MELFDKTIGDWLEFWATKNPNRDFMVYPDRQLRFSWSEFNQRVDFLANAQVVAIASPKYGEDVGMFIIPHEGAELVEEDVKEFCKDKIARYKIPRYVFFVNEYPLTGSGKIQKFKLREMALELCKERGISII